jgi:hypothetical protein
MVCGSSQCLQFAVTANNFTISLILQTIFSKLSHLTVTLNVQDIINNKLTLNICYVTVKIRYKNCGST